MSFFVTSLESLLQLDGGDIILFEGQSEEIVVTRFPVYLTFTFTVTTELISATSKHFVQPHYPNTHA